MALDVPDVNLRFFSSRASERDGAIVLALNGTADLSARDDLQKVLDKLHAEAMRLGVRQIELDVRQLEFMNSSCFQAVVSWIGQAQLLDAAAQYKIRILSNPDMHWQKRSLHALRCFADQLITVDTD